MDEELQLLVGRLPGLEAAKKAIEEQIAEICRRVAAETGDQGQSNPPPAERETLGGGAIGRVKRRRNISPELRARKVELICKARAAKLLKIEAMKGLKEPANSNDGTAK
jgi:hypothetical protein